MDLFWNRLAVSIYDIGCNYFTHVFHDIQNSVSVVLLTSLTPMEGSSYPKSFFNMSFFSYILSRWNYDMDFYSSWRLRVLGSGSKSIYAWHEIIFVFPILWSFSLQSVIAPPVYLQVFQPFL